MHTRRTLLAVVLVGSFGPAYSASADRLDFKFDVTVAPFYNGGERIPYEVYIQIVDVEGNGRDSQGLASFTFDIMSNTGISTGPAAFSRTRTTGPATTTIISPKWRPGVYPNYVPFNTSGLGFNGIADTGNPTSRPGSILGIGASIPVTWDADIDHEFPGLQPHAMHNAGWGTPGEALDVGGSPILDPRGKWYLVKGQVAAPFTPGQYSVQLGYGSLGGTIAALMISPAADLNFDITGAGLVVSATNIYGDSFSFQVIPEPGSVVLVPLAAAAVTVRRRR